MKYSLKIETKYKQIKIQIKDQKGNFYTKKPVWQLRSAIIQKSNEIREMT